MQTKVLVVDDDLALCEFIQEVLTSEKLHVHVLTDSAQAAARVKMEKFDAAFLDIRMPSPDGIELARQIRSSGLNKTIPLVMITGEQDHDVMSRAFAVGVNLFLFKPVDRTRLLRLLNAAHNFIDYEKRRFARVKVCKGVSIESGDRRISGTTLDLSLEGMCVRASNLLPAGSAVRASLELTPGAPALRVTARVVRICGDDCMGLQIEDAKSEQCKGLQEFLLPLIAAEVS